MIHEITDAEEKARKKKTEEKKQVAEDATNEEDTEEEDDSGKYIQFWNNFCKYLKVGAIEDEK